MLFKVTDIKGSHRWINPVYVRLIRERRGRTELWIAGQNHAIYLAQPLDDVAAVVNASMPAIDALPAEAGSADDDASAVMLMLAGGVV